MDCISPACPKSYTFHIRICSVLKHQIWPAKFLPGHLHIICSCAFPAVQVSLRTYFSDPWGSSGVIHQQLEERQMVTCQNTLPCLHHSCYPPRCPTGLPSNKEEAVKHCSDFHPSTLLLLIFPGSQIDILALNFLCKHNVTIILQK